MGDEKLNMESSATELVALNRMAARLGVPSVWLKGQAEAGNVPGLRAGNRWLFVPEAVTDAVKAMAGDPMAQLLAPQKPQGGAK
jgi:hypothetical protein